MNSDTQWRRRSRPLLIAAGLPDFVIDSERRWHYVLLHGDDELESGWSPMWLTKQQAGDLLALLEAHYKDQTGLDLLLALRSRLDAL